MSDEEMDLFIANPEAYAGIRYRDLPEPSPGCKECHKYDAWSEAKIDADLARLKEIWEMGRLYPTREAVLSGVWSSWRRKQSLR
jgi:hypothetical protein